MLRTSGKTGLCESFSGGTAADTLKGPTLFARASLDVAFPTRQIVFMLRRLLPAVVASVRRRSFIATASASAAAPIDFAHQIVPILRTHCGKCHTGDQKKGGLSLNTRADLLAGGESGAGRRRRQERR